MRLKLVISISALLLIAYFDWITGVNLSYSFLYFIPLIFIAFQSRCKIMHLVVNALVALLSWDIIYLFHTDFEVGLELIVNSIMRILLYFFVPYLIMIYKRQKNELELSNKELAQLNIEKNNFLGIAAHDIRSIAGAINSFASLIQSEEDPERIRKFGTIIFDSSKRLIHLVTYLLDISKIESGTIKLNKRVINYIAFIKSRIDLFSILAEKKDISIALDSSTESIALMMDPMYLSEVIDNLLSNAIKYSYQGTEIIVKISISDKTVLTEVIDKGMGIKENELAGLFEPFKKTSNKPTGGETSTGLGLAIAKKIVNLHKGTIGANSKGREGTTFYYYLPLEV